MLELDLDEWYGTRRVSSNHYEVLAYLVLKFVVGAFILLILDHH